ncbi:MAG: nucleotidyltransferase substrate binding protein [Pirellulales bacterium]|nr:nucleotidyltransferase substrate binding protein [Pirellulales bacterium]
MSKHTISKNFGKALAKLQEFVSLPQENDRDRAGVIQAFEFTFEQCWKTCQRIASFEGLPTHSPREALLAAMQLQLIRSADEEHWLEMLHDRNMTSHLYQKSLAKKIAKRVEKVYLPLLNDVYQEFQK